MKIKIIAFLLVALSAQGRALAQTDVVLLTRIESSIRRQEPNWKFVRKSQTKNGNYVAFDWKSGKSTVLVFVAFYESTKDAANGLKKLPSFFEDGGLKMTVLPTTIPNLGDENYAWKDCCDERFMGIDFRKGSVVVHVNAPSIEIAQRFASHIAGALSENSSTIKARTGSLNITDRPSG